MFTRDFSLPNANSRFSGRHDLSSYHGQVTLYLSSSNLSVLLKILSALSLSESRGDSVIPIDSNFQKSLGLFGRDLSGGKRLVSFTAFVECVRISRLYYGVSSAGSVNIHPSFDASMYKPGCSSTLWVKIKSK